MSDESPQPEWLHEVPWCRESCPHHDGKRCRLLGARPSTICEPAVQEMGVKLATIAKTVEQHERMARNASNDSAIKTFLALGFAAVADALGRPATTDAPKAGR